jgi:hypothetical protein
MNKISRRVGLGVASLVLLGVGATTALASTPNVFQSAATDAGSAAPANYVALNTPTRVWDTRPDAAAFVQNTGTLGARKTYVLDASGLPADATAITLNVTVTDTTLGGFLTAWPDGQSMPGVSSLNWGSAGTIVSNEVTVTLPADRKIDFYNFQGNVDVTADFVGYYEAAPEVPTTTQLQSVAATSTDPSTNGKGVELTHVGGSIATGVTQLSQSVPVTPGATYRLEASAVLYRLAGSSSSVVPDTYGTFLAYYGGSISSDFTNVVYTDGGVQIPKMSTVTGDIDPTESIVTTFTVPAGQTSLTLGQFAYDNDRSSAGQGDFSVVLQNSNLTRVSG